MDSGTKECIACAEDIKANAVLCKHCGTRQDSDDFISSAGKVTELPHPTDLANCGRCNAANQPKVGLCTKCGVNLPYSMTGESPTEKDLAFAAYRNREKPALKGNAATSSSSAQTTKRASDDSRKRRSAQLWIIVVLAVLAALNGQNILQYVTGQLSGQVTIQGPEVERAIEAGVLQDLGLSVKADCGDRIQGSPGDTRQCMVEDALGNKTLVDVTIQDSRGRFTWVTK